MTAVWIVCSSHRARTKARAMLGDELGREHYSLRRETGKGVYRVSPEAAERALTITGVRRFRAGDDLMPCWSRA